MRKRLMEKITNVVMKVVKPFQAVFKRHKNEIPKEKQGSEVLTSVQSYEKSDHYYEITHKKEQMLKNLSKSIEKQRIQNQCNCLHKNGKEFDVRIAKRTKEEIVFECRNCRKKIYVNPISESDIDQAIRNIDIMCDTIKLNLNLESDKDMELATLISEYQYFTLIRLGTLYSATQKFSRIRTSTDSSTSMHK